MKRVALRGVGTSGAKPDGLEDQFPGRWNARREMWADAGVVVDAVAQAVESAGWWVRGSGEVVQGGHVVGIDDAPVEPATRFAQDTARGEGVARATDFLFALPSSMAAIAGVAFGLERYQSTVTMRGLSGFRAIAHAHDLLATGRLDRMVVSALSVGDGGAFTLAVAWCLEGVHADRMLTTASIESCDLSEREPAGATATAEWLEDTTLGCRDLAAPSLLAVQRWLDSAQAGDSRTFAHRDTRFDGVGSMTVIQKPEIV